MKLSRRKREDLLTLIKHTRRDIDYGVGGSFGDGEKFYKGEMASAERAIEIIKGIILDPTNW